MTPKRFLILTVIVSVITAIVIIVMNQFETLAEHNLFSIITACIFLLTTVLIYIAGNRLAGNKNRFLFSYVVIASIFFKLIFAVFIILIYQKMAEPDNKYFVLPFIFIYLIFTVFETYFLSLIAKNKSPKSTS